MAVETAATATAIATATATALTHKLWQVSSLLHELHTVRAQQYVLGALPAIEGSELLQVCLLQVYA